MWSLITINFFLFGVAVVYDTIMAFYDHMQQPFVLVVVAVILLGGSLESLRRGDEKLAKGLTVCFLHAVCFFASYYQGAYLVGICALQIYPFYCLLLDVSVKYILINSFIYLLHFCVYFGPAYEIFKLTLTNEQTFQFYALSVASFMLIIKSATIAVVKTSCEKDIWKLVEINFKKSQGLTKELVTVIGSRDAFVTALSHETKQTFTSMNKSLNYLHDITKNQAHLEALKNVQVNFEASQNIINNLIDVFELSQREDETSDIPTDFSQLTEKALAFHASTIKNKAISARVLIDKSLPKKLLINASRLSQTMMNLISNALKYTQANGEVSICAAWCRHDTSIEILTKPVDIDSVFRNLTTMSSNNAAPPVIAGPLNIRLNRSNRVEETLEEFTHEEARFRQQNQALLKQFETNSLENVIKASNSLSKSTLWHIHYAEPRSVGAIAQVNSASNISPLVVPLAQNRKGYLRVQITDKGQGIAADVVANLSSQHQGDWRSNPTEPAFGLWICKRLCQKMNGDIRAYSQLNHGTTFVFYVPVENAGFNTLINVRLPTRPPGKVTCLVVDDYPFNRDLHKLILEKEDVHVTVAGDGKEALETYIKHGGEYFDFILMDVRMPVMDGFESAKEIRVWERQENKKMTGIYFVSGDYFTEDDVVTKLRSGEGVKDIGDVRCLRKPIDVEMLRRLIKNFRERLRR